MYKKSAKLCMIMILIGLCCNGCSETKMGANQETTKENISTEKTASKSQKLHFGTDRFTVMNAIKSGTVEVENDEKYGDNPECIESCKATSGLFHVDVFDREKEYKEKDDGTYMVQIIFDAQKFQTTEGKQETSQLLPLICKQLNITYKKETLWNYLEDALLTPEEAPVIDVEYQENTQVVITRQSNDTEIQLRFIAQEKQRTAEKKQLIKNQQECFDTNRNTVMDAIKNETIKVETDEQYGDYPECMQSCKATSDLFHMDIFDRSKDYKKKNDGTYMVQIIFDAKKLPTEEGKEEALQLLSQICEQLDITYKEDILWNTLQEVLNSEEEDAYIDEDYQKDAHIVVTKQALGKEIQIRFTSNRLLGDTDI